MDAVVRQTGMSLVEVLVALLVLAVGVLGAALLQLNALKQTDSALRSTHIRFIAHDLLERMRANPEGRYALASLEQAPNVGNLNNARDQDLFDFADPLRRLPGINAQASVTLAKGLATLSVSWDDSRAAGDSSQRQTLTLSSAIGPLRGVQP